MRDLRRNCARKILWCACGTWNNAGDFRRNFLQGCGMRDARLTRVCSGTMVVGWLPGYHCRCARNKWSRQVDIARNSKAESYLAKERFRRCDVDKRNAILRRCSLRFLWNMCVKHTSVTLYWNFIVERACAKILLKMEEEGKI